MTGGSLFQSLPVRQLSRTGNFMQVFAEERLRHIYFKQILLHVLAIPFHVLLHLQFVNSQNEDRIRFKVLAKVSLGSLSDSLKEPYLF